MEHEFQPISTDPVERSRVQAATLKSRKVWRAWFISCLVILVCMVPFVESWFGRVAVAGLIPAVFLGGLGELIAWLKKRDRHAPTLTQPEVDQIKLYEDWLDLDSRDRAAKRESMTPAELADFNAARDTYLRYEKHFTDVVTTRIRITERTDA